MIDLSPFSFSFLSDCYIEKIVPSREKDVGRHNSAKTISGRILQEDQRNLQETWRNRNRNS